MFFNFEFGLRKQGVEPKSGFDSGGSNNNYSKFVSCSFRSAADTTYSETAIFSAGAKILLY